MAVKLNGAGLAHARSLIKAGKVDRTSAWGISASDENTMLGDPPNWTQYGSWHLGADSAADAATKGHWKYPFGKSGKVYRRAVIAIKTRAAQQGVRAIADAAASLLDAIDKDAKGAALGPGDFLFFSVPLSAATEGDPPKAKAQQLLKWGPNQPIDGRPAVMVDDAWADAALALFAGRTVEYAIDYNHASLFSMGEAPAAGWIVGLRAVRPTETKVEAQQGIWLVPEWTPRGFQAVRDKEYLYLSAVIPFDRQIGQIIPGIVGAGLTNTPAIHGLEAVAASARRAVNAGEPADEREEPMNLDEFVSTCGFESPENLAAALKAGKEAVAKLTTDLATSDAKVKALEDEKKNAAVAAAMARAEGAGQIPAESDKLTEPQKALRALALKVVGTDPELFEQWVKTLPKVPTKAAPEGVLPLKASATDGVDGETPEAQLAKVQAYAKEHSTPQHTMTVGEAHEAMGVKRAAN